MQDWGERCVRWAGVRSEVVTVHGTAVHTLRAGDGTDGTPQLLVHGLGGAALNWLEVLPGLAERGPVLAPDLPGFGRTEPPVPGASRVRANARFLVALLAELSWDRVVVHGVSMGGLLSVLFAELAPGRLERLVLTAPALPTDRRQLPKLDRETFARFAPFAVPGVGAAVLRRMWSTMTPEELYEDAVALMYHDASRITPEYRAVAVANLAVGQETPWRLTAMVVATESLVAALLGGRELRHAIDAVAAPTLVVWGEQDRLVGRPVIDEIVRRRPDWELAVLDDVGHVPAIETPDRYLEVVGAWLAASPASPLPSRV